MQQIAEWLQKLGLEQYGHCFAANSAALASVVARVRRHVGNHSSSGTPGILLLMLADRVMNSPFMVIRSPTEPR